METSNSLVRGMFLYIENRKITTLNRLKRFHPLSNSAENLSPNTFVQNVIKIRQSVWSLLRHTHPLYRSVSGCNALLISNELALHQKLFYFSCLMKTELTQNGERTPRVEERSQNSHQSQTTSCNSCSCIEFVVCLLTLCLWPSCGNYNRSGSKGLISPIAYRLYGYICIHSVVVWIEPVTCKRK